MAEQATIARPYARAAFEYAHAHNALKQWSDALAIAAAIAADPNVVRLLNNPRVAPAQIVDLIADVSGNTLDSASRNFVATLAANRRIALLPQIAAMYEAMRADVENRARVSVTSAAPLNEAQQQRLASALKKRLNREVQLDCSVDPELLGGAVIRCGDLVIDGSVKSRLAQLAAEVRA
ncbi:MAG TPA: F0F1 ATP synthase subunit delta [Steroidobacteraceae bacterium]|nr:F0F1 ATP synthase subunit delta [Steroidobacteraceae bacterium]